MLAFKLKKTEDLSYGFDKEDTVKPFLDYYFDTNLIKTDEYDTFDYVDKPESMMIELKSRRVNRKQYPDTMVGYNKVKKGIELMKQENGGYDIYYAFDFKDSIAIYKFEKLNKSWIRKGGRKDRGKAELKDYYYIPTNKLKIIIKKRKISDANRGTESHKIVNLDDDFKELTI